MPYSCLPNFGYAPPLSKACLNRTSSSTTLILGVGWTYVHFLLFAVGSSPFPIKSPAQKNGPHIHPSKS